MDYKSVAQVAQQMVAKIAVQDLGFNELSIYNYDPTNESPEATVSRYDGILASVANNDIIIFQSPSWNSLEWDNGLMDRTFIYSGIKRIIFIHDVIPLMFKSNRYLLPKVIDYYNKADLIIAPSQNMVNALRKEGLTVEKIVIQKMWDHPAKVNPLITPSNNKVISFIGNPKKFQFVANWSSPNVQLQLFADQQNPSSNQNINFRGWQPDDELLNSLRKIGGFGLVWSDQNYWSQYMKLNASYKLSTYLAAGIPIIVNSDTPEKDTIIRRHLGIVADDLDTVEKSVSTVSDDEYMKMINSVDQFAELIRQGYFTKRLLVNAIFKLLYD